MRWVLLGAVLAVLLLYPSLQTLLIALIAAILSKPLVVAFGLGLAAGAHARSRGWTR